MQPPLIVTNALQAIDATHADLSGSQFQDVRLRDVVVRNADLSRAVFEDVNLSGLRVTNANLRGAVLTDCAVEGMTIEGVAVSDMMAAYRAAR
jgi:uncharacterized protein YjbI with pentapeptide repeats